MPIKWINQLFRTDPAQGQNSVHTPSRPADTSTGQTTAPLVSYPPTDKGLPVRTPEDILQANRPLLDRLQLHAAQSSDAYQTRFIDPVLRLASHINTMPASAADRFAGEGGLIRACVEMGFFSYQASDGRIFTGNETVERRHALEPRWRYVCFLAGLLYPIGQCLDKIVVVDPAGGVWKKHHGGLTAWAQSHGVERFFASWSGDDTSSTAHIGPSSYTSSLLPNVVGPHNLQWLEDGSAELVKALYEICSGQPSGAKNAQDVVVNMWEKVAHREDARRPQTYGRLTIGSHIGPYLVGALNALVVDNTWQVNTKGLIADASGLYMRWPDAGHDIAQWGQRQSYSGWPANAATIAELLKSSQIVDPNPADDSGLHELITPEGEIVKGYKIANPLAVIEDFDPEDFADKSKKRLDSVVAADPLARAEVRTRSDGAGTPNQQNKIAPEMPGEAAHPVDEHTLNLFTEAETPNLGDSHQGQRVTSQTEAQPNKSDDDGEADAPTIKEGQEVKYSDLVPDEIRKEFKRGLSVELLGKVIKAWKSRGEGSKHMRMTDNGAAITLEFLGTIVRDTPKWVGEMADAGLIYSPATTPGLKIIKVAMPEGGKTKESIILSRYAVKKLGL